MVNGLTTPFTISTNGGNVEAASTTLTICTNGADLDTAFTNGIRSCVLECPVVEMMSYICMVM